jgi:hypothetical protein
MSSSATRIGRLARHGLWIVRLAAVLMALAGACAAATTEAGAPSILVLFSFNSWLPANQEILKGVRKAMAAQNRDGVELFDEYLDADHFPGAAYQDAFVAYLKAKYAKDGVDLIIAVGPRACDFAVAYRAQIAPAAPIVVTAVDEQRFNREPLPDNTTGVVTDYDIVKTIDLARAQPRDA